MGLEIATGRVIADSSLRQLRHNTGNNRDSPILRWLDDDHLSVDLGEVTWLTPQIHHLGRVTISYTYSGTEPSLE
jgi:hypothetical protein